MPKDTLRPIRLGAPGEEFDKKDLFAVIRRFYNLHKTRLTNIQSCLTPRQRDFLDLLPLLFHVNHPLAPGFVSTETPAGISGYVPSRHALTRMSRMSKSFEYKRRAPQDEALQGIFLMGSVGSIAYSRASDLDIWLCHNPELSGESLDSLKRKATKVEAWGRELGLEVHCFFVNPQEFRAGKGEPISTESCGNIQHHLLLEEFYRTSLHIAGRIPAWWLVPPEQETRYGEYVSHLLIKRFVDDLQIVDLGGFEQISSAEFLGGTLWHLYKAIDSPHKSLLKMLLMEAYASEFPHPEWLCTRIKRAVYAGILDAAEMDAYILMYRKVESYLKARGESDRLELARRCFYLKIAEAGGPRAGSAPEEPHREAALRAVARDWHWQPAQFAAIEGHKRWGIAQLHEEHRTIAAELKRAFQESNRFARDHATKTPAEDSELALLGRKLYAVLERKPGKVEILGKEGYGTLRAESLGLSELRLADDVSGWILRTVGRDETPLRKAHGLFEILAWLVANGFHRIHEIAELETLNGTPSLKELKMALEDLAGFARRRRSAEERLDVYAKPPRIVARALFVNLGQRRDKARQSGLQLASSRFDPFSYGAERVSLIGYVDQVTLNSWGEILVQRRYGLEGIFDCLLELVGEAQERGDEAVFECFAYEDEGRSRGIGMRIRRTLDDLKRIFRGGETGARFVLRGGPAFFAFECREGALRYWRLPDEARLLHELGAPRLKFGTVHFDENALEASPLPAIYAVNKPGVVQLFACREGIETRVYALDERGALFRAAHERLTPVQLFAPYAAFLGAIAQHCAIGAHDIEYYLVEYDALGELKPRRLENVAFPSFRKLSVRVFALELAPGRTAYSVYCNEKEFSSLDSGPELFAQVAAHILELRREGEHYPIYITDLDVPPAVLGADTPERLQTVHFLQYKRKIEERLNG